MPPIGARPPIGRAQSEQPAPVLSNRTEKLACNLFDSELLGAELCARILGGKLEREKSKLIVIDPTKEDEIAVSFGCSLETAALAIDVLRSECRKRRLKPTRAYLFRTGWVKLPPTAVLTIEYRGMIVLNPEWFPKVVSVEDAVKPEVKRVKLGSNR